MVGDVKITGRTIPPPPDPEEVLALKNSLPPGIPADYLDLFRRCDGCDIGFEEVEWSRGDFDYLQLASCREMLDAKTRTALTRVFPNLFVIGGDGGGQVLAYDMAQTQPRPIILHCPGDDTPRLIAQSMGEFIQKYLTL